LTRIFREAWAKALAAARQNGPAIAGLQAAMALVVATYYLWPTGARVITAVGAWLHQFGLPGAALSTVFAGAILSEFAAVYLQDGGRWTRAHVEHMLFRCGLFLVGGSIVYEFYHAQARWFGTGPGWRHLLPKVLVDQFIYTPFWAVPYQTIMSRWHALGFSGRRLAAELRGRFLAERALPVQLTNWMFWIPGVTLIYSMPLQLQTPLFIFATAIWSLLLAAHARPRHEPDNALLPTTTEEAA
jgi:hypothetical protein